MTVNASQPIRDRLIDENGYCSRPWRNYLFAVQNTTDVSAQVLQTTTLANQIASIATTPIPLPALSTGFYRISVYALILLAASVSSSLTVTIAWTDNGLTCSRVVPALTTNISGSTTSVTFPIHVDNASPVTYAVAYASNAAAQMVYSLGIVVEAL